MERALNGRKTYHTPGAEGDHTPNQSLAYRALVEYLVSRGRSDDAKLIVKTEFPRGPDGYAYNEWLDVYKLLIGSPPRE